MHKGEVDERISIEALRGELRGLESKLSEQSQFITGLESQKLKLNETLEGKEIELKEYKQHLDALNKELVELKTQYEHKEAEKGILAKKFTE